MDSVEDWVENHSPEGLAQIVINGQKTIQKLAESVRELSAYLQVAEEDCVDLLNDLNQERKK